VNLPRLPAVTAYLGLSAVSSVAFYCYATVAAIYRIDLAALDPLELVLVGTVLELSVFLFEIPTGVVADVYSRRLSIAIGLLLTGVGFAVEAARPIPMPSSSCSSGLRGCGRSPRSRAWR
jgi:DHA3 family tetracycline resistance protein-like MFS transporter